MATATTTVEKPERGLSWMLRQSTTESLAIVVTGSLAIALVLLGPIFIVPIQGLKPVETLIDSLTSSALSTTFVIGSGLGLLAAIAGIARYRSMPTKVSKGQAIAGAVLGVQALLLGIGLYVFVNGERVDVFALNYLNFEVVDGEYDAFVNGFWNTIKLASLSELTGIILGLIFSVFAISKRAVVRAPARIYINFFRGTPLVWQIVFIGVALPIGLGIKIPAYTAAIIALSLNAGAYTAEVFRAGIQSIERGQIEAARGLGMSYGQAMWHAIIPQAVRRVIPPLMNEFVILIKDTSLVFVLGLTAGQRELMATGNNLQQNTFNATFLIFTALGYLCVSLPAIRIVNAVERRLRSGLVGISA